MPVNFKAPTQRAQYPLSKEYTKESTGILSGLHRDFVGIIWVYMGAIIRNIP